MSPPGRRFTCLTLREKLDIINAVNEGVKRKKIMAQYQMPASTLSCLLRQRDQLMKKMSDREVNPSSKRIRTVDSPELEEKMRGFVNECREGGVTLTGNLMLSKAREFAQTLGLSTFRASNGWLYNFKKRHGICMRRDKVGNSGAKADQSTTVLSQNVHLHPECNSTTDNDDPETTNTPADDEDLVTMNDTLHFERDALKLEAFDVDDTPADDEYDTRSEHDFGVNKFNNDARNVKSHDRASKVDVEFVNAGGSSGARAEDEFDSFGRYIASALRAMPGVSSIVARTELQNTLSRVQMSCVKRTQE